MKIFFNVRLIISLTAVVFLFDMATAFSQTKSDETTNVAFFGSTANSVSDSSITGAELEAFSIYIFQTLASDTNTQQVNLYPFANVGYIGKDSLLNPSSDTVYTSAWSPSPDSAMYGIDYYIENLVTGKAGNYTLTVNIKDAHSKKIVCSGTANFSSTTSSNIQIAAVSAASAILPLITVIRNYQVQERGATPGSCIDPQLQILSPTNSLDPKEKINVGIQATDFDGYPLKNFTINLSSTGGTFAQQQVQTDTSGKATVSFTASDTPGTAVMYAELDSIITITGDTVTVDDESYAIIGSVDSVVTQYYTKKIYQLKFTVSIKNVYLNDHMFSPDVFSTQWDQSSKSEVYTASGFVKGTGIYVPLNNSFVFIADTGKVTGKYYKDSFSLGSYYTLDPCSDRLIMSVNTRNGIVNKKKVFSQTPSAAQIQYNPGNSAGTIKELTCAVPYNYNISQNSFGQPAGTYTTGTTDCVRDYSPSISYQPNQNTTLNVQTNDTDPGLILTKVGSNYIIDYYNVVIWSNTTTDLTGYTYNATITQFNGTLSPFKKSVTSVAIGNINTPPKTFHLSQNYPNPFNPSTIIEYQIPNDTHVKILIFDIMGNQVAELLNGNVSAGTHVIRFNGIKLASGVYFYRIEAGEFSETKKFVLIK